ncbi:hypothetical protein PENTCL1PPCAC_20411, partial [Pristionchus entomophagus]
GLEFTDFIATVLTLTLSLFGFGLMAWRFEESPSCIAWLIWLLSAAVIFPVYVIVKLCSCVYTRLEMIETESK